MAKEKTATTAADVLSANGAVVRTYTEEVHGKDFAELAKEFAEQTKGFTVVER